MMRTWGRRTGAALAIGLTASAITALLAAPRTNDQAQLGKLIAQMEEGFEDKSAEAVLGYIAQDYQDAEGLDRQDVIKIVERLCRGTHRVDLDLEDQQIEVNGDRATGQFDAVAVITEGGDRITWPMKLEVQFARERTAWWLPWHKQWVVQSAKGHGMKTWLEEL